MKLLIWSQYYWPETFGINDLAVDLVKQGHEVTVLTGKPNYPGGRIYDGYRSIGISVESIDGVRIVRVPVVPRGDSKALNLLLNYFSFIASGYVLAPFALRKMRFDAVFVYGVSPVLQALPAIWIAWLKGAPLSVWVQDLWPESLRATKFITNSVILSMVCFFVRHIYKRSDSILISSEAFKIPVVGICGQPEKVHYFPNQTPSPQLSDTGGNLPDTLKADMSATFSVVFAGNIGKAQSVGTVLSAAADLADIPDICFYIVGAGSEAEDIALKIASMALTNVKMTGFLPQSVMPKLFEAASALLITLRQNPALDATVPSKLQAYLSAGKPIVASMNGEGARLVQHARAGLISPAGDGPALALCVRRLYGMTFIERSIFHPGHGGQ